jgi:hypothetical protein
MIFMKYKMIVSRESVILFFHWIYKKFVIGPDQIYFSFLMTFSVNFFSIEDLQLLILKLLPFGGLFTLFDLAGLN